MAQPATTVGHEVINLISDDEDWEPDVDNPDFFDTRAARELMEDLGPIDQAHNTNNQISTNRQIPFDLTAIPDIDIPPTDPSLSNNDLVEKPSHLSNIVESVQSITQAECLQSILDVLPDISVTHVLEKIRGKTTNVTITVAQCNQLLDELLEDGKYPQETADSKRNKRKRDDEDTFSHYEKADQPEISGYERDA